jgi:hypothetical protein
MWEGIDNSQQSKNNLSWLVEGMESNSLTWVMDGLYDRKRAADICGVGWIIFCSNRATSDRRILGEITISKFKPCRNAWPMCPTPIRQSAFRVL